MNSSTKKVFTVQDKDTNKKRSIEQKFYDLLYHRACTCSMASELLGEYQKNLTRIKRRWEKQGRLWVIKLDRCQITKRNGVQVITTNPSHPELFFKSNQLNLFNDAE